MGRSVIVHEKADKFTQPVGDAGGRVAIGIIGWAKPPGK
jgi:Cu/Zn superoxide dismutase